MSDLVIYNAQLAQLRQTVAQLDTVDEAKDLADRAAAAQTWARAARLGLDAVNQAAEVKLRAERRAGQLLNGTVTPGRPEKRSSLPTISDMGVTKDQSAQWQKLAAIPDKDFDHAIEQTKDEGDVISRRGVMDIHYSSATDLWSTPQDLYDQLNAEFNFTLDVCAVPDNAKCDTYFTETEDGLQQDWRGTCWMNPPYGDAISNWVAKAHTSADEGATVVCLVPARVDTGWWWDHCRQAEIRFLRGRLKFGGGQNSAPFPSAVVIFGRSETVIWWER